jgi:ABC-type Fe3+-siderophore transport system permease subunit
MPAGAVPRGADYGTLRLTARGTALAVFSLCFPGTLTSGWLHMPVLSGASFVAACLLAALATRREDLLVVVTLPPLMFAFSAICVAAVSSDGGGFLAAASGVALTLGAAVVWLLIGEALLIVLSLFRGLPAGIRDLRADLRGEP